MTNPLTKYEQPPYPSQSQEVPGMEAAMRPQADHGETSYQGSGKLLGRKALITGSDSGIGRAVALAFAREGADVVISYLDEHDDARETARLAEEAGRKAVLIPGDIADEAHCATLINDAAEQLGGLDILVNNAAYQMARQSLQDVSTEEWERTFTTNVTAMFWLCKAAEQYLKPGSTVINKTSVNAYKAPPILVAYSATKSAIQNFTASLAQLWAEKGIRVNCVAPGPIWTPLIPAAMPQEELTILGATEYRSKGRDSPQNLPLLLSCWQVKTQVI